jgi:multidrug efflux pump subunit AcrA (membrane-fusion protein)
VAKLLHVVRRGPVIIGLVVVVVAGGGVAWAMSRSSGSTAGTTSLVAAAMNTVTSTVAASGTIEPAKEADLDFAVNGRVTKVRVKAGSNVHKGERLASVSRVALVASKDAAAATVTAAADTVAADTSATSATQVASDKAALTAARSSLRSAKTALADSSLRATIAGTVTSVDLTVGEQVSGGSSSTGAATEASDSSDSSSSSGSQVVITSAKSFVVNATVDDTEISQVHKAQSVAITPAGANAPVTGTVTSVSSVPTSSSGVVSFAVVVGVTGHPSGVYSGASATLSITTKKAVRVLEVPTLAIRYNGSKATVQVNDGSGAVTRSITVGTMYGLETQVLSGIKAGEKVVVTIPTFGRAFTNRTGTGGTGGGGFGGFGGGEGGFGGGGGFGGRTGTGTGGTGGGGFGGRSATPGGGG